MPVPYDERFFEEIEEGSQRSAQEVVPLVLEIIQPKSIIDVGCGTGTWLSVFRDHGVEDIWGIDGDYVSKQMLHIPEERYLTLDLRQPARLERQFDLVVSLEVGEHLPTEVADTFVDSLVGLGPVVLFSAAIPFQVGTNHINTQWPEYWVALFERRGYLVIDALRKRIWQNGKVKYWYAQNMLLFARNNYIEAHPTLEAERRNTWMSHLSIVHPYQFSSYTELAETQKAQLAELKGECHHLSEVIERQHEHLIEMGSLLHKQALEIEQQSTLIMRLRQDLQDTQAQLAGTASVRIRRSLKAAALNLKYKRAK